MTTSGTIEITNLYSTDLDFTLTLSIYNVNDNTYSPWSECINLNKYNLKFKCHRHGFFYTLYCHAEVKTCDIDNCSQEKLLISVKYDTYDAQFYIDSYNTDKEMGIFRNMAGQNVIIKASATQCNGPFNTMYYDEALLDFKLAVKGCSEGPEESSVGFHRTILAAWSPVMLNMFSNAWKEKNEGVLELPVKLEVLKALKKYVYIEELPDDKETLLGLVELGSYFMNPKLEISASKGILKLISPGEMWDIIIYSGMKNTDVLSRLMLMKVHNAGRSELKEAIDEIAKL